MRPEIIVPLLMGCVMLWWIGRGIGLVSKLAIAVITLAIVGAILVFEHGI